ncbi:uncharacterized protein TNCV_1459061 [Trichonephila clavipes]|nr:uncharacterized protein TNCV_1459061 [Trichonephila clavipes]
MAALVSEYTLEFFTLLNARGKKELIEWCMKEGLIASSYECPKYNEQMGLNERKSVVLDGFEWRCRKKGVNTHDSIDLMSSLESKLEQGKKPPNMANEKNGDQPTQRDKPSNLCENTEDMPTQPDNSPI